MTNSKAVPAAARNLGEAVEAQLAAYSGHTAIRGVLDDALKRLAASRAKHSDGSDDLLRVRLAVGAALLDAKNDIGRLTALESALAAFKAALADDD